MAMHVEGNPVWMSAKETKMTGSSGELAALVEELRGVLEEERRTLLAGDPEPIHAVTRRKLALAEAIEAASAVPGARLPQAETLTALARYNQQNGVICSAMLRHLRLALDRLRQHDLHRSYNADGSERRAPARHALGAA